MLCNTSKKQTFLCPRIDKSGTYSFWPVRSSVCPFVCPQKRLHSPYLLIGNSSGLHISHEYSLCQDLSVGTKFKVICQGQFRISRSQFKPKKKKNGRCEDIRVSQTHLFLSCMYIFLRLIREF